MRIVVAWLLAAGLLIGSPVAAQSDESSLEREAKAIETMVIAPCCWSQQVSVHQSPAAEGMKARIREMLGAGMERRQVLEAFESEFGSNILAEPPARGFNLFLYVFPPVAFVLTAAGLWTLVRRMTRNPVPAGSALSTELEARYAARLQDEIEQLD
jgi:cytochrome c-type biogenesis protein CcmH/NrfF